LIDRFKEHDREFEEYLGKNPGGTYSRFSVAQQADEIVHGIPHATLGPRLARKGDWWEAGVATYRALGKLLKPSSSMRIMDYGCGSLRVGAHFIRDHDPDCYFGLDVTNDFYDYGRELIGSELFHEKRPRLATISPDSLNEAAEFEPDIVISTACAFHVHPDEKSTYIRNILSIARKKGARFAFDTVLTPKLLRYNESGWGRPLTDYIEVLAPMTLQPERSTTRFESGGHEMEYAYLVFRR
jgi:hypothetical protein